MPKKLTDKRLARLRKRLDERFGELSELIRRELLASDDENYAALAERVHDTAEESVADLLADVNLAVIDHHIQELQRVEGALMRLRAGTYGICVDCDGEIEVDRLEAYPEAMRCHDCQERYERTQAQPGHARL